jgi:hypothetical protein
VSSKRVALGEGHLLLDRGPSDYSSPLAMDGKSKRIEEKLDVLVSGFIRQAGEARIKRREGVAWLMVF